jgi:hypothetical protein
MWHVWGKRRGAHRVLVRKPKEKKLQDGYFGSSAHPEGDMRLLGYVVSLVKNGVMDKHVTDTP